MFNLAAIYHEAKSKYAYAYDNRTLHIRIRTAKDDVDQIKLIFGDPFNWGNVQKHEDPCAYLKSHHLIKEMSKDFSTNMHDYYFVSISPKWRRCRYVFIIEKDCEKILFGSHTIEDLVGNPDKAFDLFNYFNFPFINEVDIFKVPDWIKSTVWYQIFPERFSNGDSNNDPSETLPWGSIKENVKNDMFFGGDIQGVINNLDYLKDLGITGIYFTPIFKSYSSHKYDTVDYFQIDPQFGDNETFKKLVDIAHQNNIKIMLDAVFNHCGWHHPFWQDVIENQEKSAYKDYFHIKKFPVFNGDIENFEFIQDKNELNFDTFAFTPNMPKWNTENKEVKKYLLEIGTYWVKEYDIDGWRLDVSNEVDHAFWRDFKRAMDEHKKEFYILGENWDESNPWLRGEQFSGVMNYSFTFPVWNFFGKGTYDALDFKNEISSLMVTYPKNVMHGMFNLLDSHDTERILSICFDNVDKVKLAYLFLLTFTGSPSIYYGGEVGLTGKGDPDSRRCMIWDKLEQNQLLYQFIKSLIKIRKQSKALQSGEFFFINLNKEKNQLIYQKKLDEECIIVFINNNKEKGILTIPNELDGHKVVDLLTHEETYLSKELNLEPYGYKIVQVI